MEKTVTLFLARSTAGTHVYTEQAGPRHLCTFPTIYVQRPVLPSPPAKIEVTMKWEAK